jgi:uncharacterized OB-fold protein
MIEPLVAGLRPEPHERPYWDALREHRLVLQQCIECGQRQHYPRSVCMSCLSDSLNYVDCSGRGSVYSYTVIRRPPLPALRSLVPYALALVDLDDGVRMVSNIVGDPEQVRIGRRVAVDFCDVTDEVTLPVFRLLPDGWPAT